MARRSSNAATRRRSLAAVLMASILAACVGHGSVTAGDDVARIALPAQEATTSGETDLCAASTQPLDLRDPTLPIPPNIGHNRNCDWDYFAWNSFAALNWPALESDPALRGFPDTSTTTNGFSRSFETAENDDIGVWETYKEKREVFDPSPASGWNDPPSFPRPQNLTEENGGFCSAQDRVEAEDIDRYFGSLTKAFATLDETVEVLSEAREGYDRLCLGYLDNPAIACREDPSVHPCCEIDPNPSNGTRTKSGTQVGPRVWKGQAATSTQPVFYKVKVNYDFWQYVIDNRYNDDTTAVTDAIRGTIALPYRTAFENPEGQNESAVHDYDPAACLVGYADAAADPQSSDTPCGIGSVHLKSGWIQLPDTYDPETDPPEDDPAGFHTTRAVYYRSVDNDQVCMTTGLFGLVGFHIIQRVHIDPSTANANNGALGGTFVYATWEHESVLDSNGTARYTYVNYPFRSNTTPPPPYPTLDRALPVTRTHPILPQAVEANANVHQRLPENSVWRRYHLIGTQFLAADRATSRAIAQPHFLANLVIETNDGLQTFEGFPPNQPAYPAPQYTKPAQTYQPLDDAQRVVPANPTLRYLRNQNNLVQGGQGYNMGGCMGCHGVAQQNGYAFSFVFLAGQQGTERVDSEGSFDFTPPGFPKEIALLFIESGESERDEPLVIEATVEGVKAAPRTGQANQLWRLRTPFPGDGFTPATEPGSGYFQFTLDRAQLALSSGDTPGSPVRLVTSDQRDGSQFWQFLQTQNRSLAIRNLGTGLVMTVGEDRSVLVDQAQIVPPSADGTNPLGGDLDAVADQTWTLEVIEPLGSGY